MSFCSFISMSFLHNIEQRGEHIAQPSRANTQPMEKDVNACMQAAIRHEPLDKQQEDSQDQNPVPAAPFEARDHLALLRRRLVCRFGGVSAAYRHTKTISPIKSNATIPAPSYMLCSLLLRVHKHLDRMRVELARYSQRLCKPRAVY